MEISDGKWLGRHSWLRFLALLVALAVLVSACGGGDDDDGDGAEGADETGDVAFDPDGVLKVGIGLAPGSSSVQLDPAKASSAADFVHHMVYDTLLRRQPDGTYEPGLASSAEVVDPQTLKVTLRPDLEFSDGTPLDAEAVKFSIERAVQGNNQAALFAELFLVESVTVDSPTEVTIRLSQPAAGVFYSFFARGETMVVSPTAVRNGVDLMTNPVGAGPFTVESLEPERVIRLVKNPTHWDAENVRLAGMEIVHVTPDAAVNALRSSAIDAYDGASPEIVSALEGSNLEIVEEPSDSAMFWGFTCKSRPPLDDVRVRQALNYGLDREQLNEFLFDGKSEPMWGFWTSSSEYHNPDLEGYYDRDIEKAKDLLADAGYPDGFEIEFVVPATGGIGQTATEIVKEQWAEIGVDLKIATSSNILEDFFTDNPRYPGHFILNFNAGVFKVSRILAGNGLGNICDWNHPGLNDLLADIRALDPDSDEAVEVWHDIQELALEEAMNIFGLFGLNANIWNPDRLATAEHFVNYAGQLRVSPWSTYVKP